MKCIAYIRIFVMLVKLVFHYWKRDGCFGVIPFAPIFLYLISLYIPSLKR